MNRDMNAWMDGCINKLVERKKDRQRYECLDGWLVGRMDGQMDG